MSVYIIFITILFFLTFISTDKKYYKIASFGVYVIYMLFIGFRYQTGFDWTGYFNGFESIKFKINFIDEIIQVAKIHKHEPFYVLFAYIIKYIFKSFFFITFITTYLLYFMYKKLAKEFKINKNSLLLLVLLFTIFTTHFSVLRQSLAIVFFNLAIVQWRKSKKIYLFLMLISFLFHFSAIMYIVFFITSQLIVKIKNYISVQIFYILLVTLGVVLPRIVPITGTGRVALKIKYYLTKVYEGNSLEQIYTLGFYFFILLCIFLIRKKIKKKNKWIAHYIMLSVVFSLIFFNTSAIRNRILYQMIIFFSLLLLIYRRNSYSIKDFKLLTLHLFGLIFFIASLLKLNAIAYIPYQSYFNVWLFNDYGNAEARQEYIMFKAYAEKRLEERAIRQNKVKEFEKMKRDLEIRAGIKRK